jgi:NRAMP (natural resistance-associated macrophage protein)-like metal ion transporter
MKPKAAPRPPSPSAAAPRAGPVRRFFASLGPGLITGAADDDPSGIATLSSAGAALGTSLLWTTAVTWPLMAFVQMTCARIGMVTGQGLAAALRARFPRSLLVVASITLLAANTINIGADLLGMSDAAGMLTGLDSHWFVLLFGVGISWATIRLGYDQIASALKWLALFLFAYVIAAFDVHPQWDEVLRAAVVPSLPRTRQAFSMLVAILGTTISPYLFFWQASQEVEEEKAMGRTMRARRIGATPAEIGIRRLDVGVGTFFSQGVMFFIMLTTALTLHRHGVTDIQTSRQAAEALKPLAGRFAAGLYTFGLVGVGLLAIPTLSGSAAYAFAETFGWRQGLDQKLRSARSFYGIVIASTALGIAMDFARLNPVKALFWTAVLNGLIAPFLLIGILLVASDRKVMHGQPIPILSRVIVGATTLAMFAAAVGMFVL